MSQPPPPSEAGDGGEGRRGEAHHRVRDRHVAHKQVHPRVQARGPAGCNTVTHVGDDMTGGFLQKLERTHTVQTSSR